MRTKLAEPHYSFDQILSIGFSLTPPIPRTVSIKRIRTHALNTKLAKEVQASGLAGCVRYLVPESAVLYLLRDLTGERDPEITLSEIQHIATRLDYRKL